MDKEKIRREIQVTEAALSRLREELDKPDDPILNNIPGAYLYSSIGGQRVVTISSYNKVVIFGYYVGKFHYYKDMVDYSTDELKDYLWTNKYELVKELDIKSL